MCRGLRGRTDDRTERPIIITGVSAANHKTDSARQRRKGGLLRFIHQISRMCLHKSLIWVDRYRYEKSLVAGLNWIMQRSSAMMMMNSVFSTLAGRPPLAFRLMIFICVYVLCACWWFRENNSWNEKWQLSKPALPLYNETITYTEENPIGLNCIRSWFNIYCFYCCFICLIYVIWYCWSNSGAANRIAVWITLKQVIKKYFYNQ